MSLRSRDATAEAIHAILTNSDYFPYLFRTANMIGFRIEEEAMVVSFDFAQEEMDLDYYPDYRECSPELWVVLSEADLLQAAQENLPLRGVRLETSEKGQVLNPTIDRILLRCLSGRPPYPVEDRDELVYGALFGFEDPDILWISQDADVEVQRFLQPTSEQIALVTSGLSDPDRVAPSANGESESHVSCYELVILLESANDILERQFCGWVEYRVSTGKHLLLGQYLEYDEGAIPGTDLGGFLIVPPESLPPSFPVVDTQADWHLFLGVTPRELEEAKVRSVSTVAELLAQNGMGDLTSANRPSVLS